MNDKRILLGVVMIYTVLPPLMIVVQWFVSDGWGAFGDSLLGSGWSEGEADGMSGSDGTEWFSMMLQFAVMIGAGLVSILAFVKNNSKVIMALILLILIEFIMDSIAFYNHPLLIVLSVFALLKIKQERQSDQEVQPGGIWGMLSSHNILVLSAVVMLVVTLVISLYWSLEGRFAEDPGFSAVYSMIPWLLLVCSVVLMILAIKNNRKLFILISVIFYMVPAVYSPIVFAESTMEGILFAIGSLITTLLSPIVLMSVIGYRQIKEKV